MATEIRTSIEINASPEKIWKVFSNFENYPNWNPFLTEVSGEVKAGNQIKINAGGMIFKPTVLKFEENKELRWLGKLLFSGIFDGEHYFEIIDKGNGTSTFVHGENFKGILVPLFKSKLTGETKDGFVKMNKKLKELVEG